MSIEITSNYDEIVQKIDSLNSRLLSLNIGSDIDGVEVNSAAGFLRILNKRHNTSLNLRDMENDWDSIRLISKYIPTIKEPKGYAVEIWNSPDNLTTADPVPGALLISKFLYDQNIKDIHRITSRPASTKEATLTWYKNKMPWVRSELVHFQNTETIFNSDFKIETINELGLNLFFEDSVEHAEKIAGKTKATVVLIPQYWNADYEPPATQRIIVVNKTFFTGYPVYLRAYLNLVGKI